MPTIYKDEIKHISKRGQEIKPARKRQKLVFTYSIDQYDAGIINAVTQPGGLKFVWHVSGNVFAASDNEHAIDPSLYLGKEVRE